MRFAQDSRIWSGVLLFIGSALFLVAVTLGEALAPDYSVHTNAVSDLGTISESQALFNFSLIALGGLVIVGGYLYYLHHRRPWILAFFVLLGIGALGAGIFTLNTSGIHGLFALIAFTFGNLTAVGTATILRGPMRVISAILGIVGLIVLVLHAASDFGFADLYGPIGHGGSERMIIYPVLIFQMVLSGYLMSYAREAPLRGPPLPK